jgi:hypothetical protein
MNLSDNASSVVGRNIKIGLQDRSLLFCAARAKEIIPLNTLVVTVQARYRRL